MILDLLARIFRKADEPLLRRMQKVSDKPHFARSWLKFAAVDPKLAEGFRDLVPSNLPLNPYTLGSALAKLSREDRKGITIEVTQGATGARLYGVTCKKS